MLLCGTAAMPLDQLPAIRRGNVSVTDSCLPLRRYTLQCFPGAKEAPKREGALFLCNPFGQPPYMKCTKAKPLQEPRRHTASMSPPRTTSSTVMLRGLHAWVLKARSALEVMAAFSNFICVDLLRDCAGSTGGAKAKASGGASIQQYFAGNHSNPGSQPDGVPDGTPG